MINIAGGLNLQDLKMTDHQKRLEIAIPGKWRTKSHSVYYNAARIAPGL